MTRGEFIVVVAIGSLGFLCLLGILIGLVIGAVSKTPAAPRRVPPRWTDLRYPALEDELAALIAERER